MSHLQKVTDTYPDLRYMQHRQAAFMGDFIAKHDCRDILEIGFCQGKSSAYIAAILEDLGRGHLVTIDTKRSLEHEPNIERVLRTLGLSHRVTPIFAHRSFTWELAKMIQSEPRPQFDLCYFDADHTWDGAALGFALVDVLLRPGGWIIFDDLPWTIEASIARGEAMPKRWRTASEDEIAAAVVGMVFDLLVPHLGYTELRTVLDGWWGIARKPLDRGSGDPHRRRTSVLNRVRRNMALGRRLRALRAGRPG